MIEDELYETFWMDRRYKIQSDPYMKEKYSFHDKNKKIPKSI